MWLLQSHQCSIGTTSLHTHKKVRVYNLLYHKPLKTSHFSKDLTSAVQMYESCTRKYKATPQQLELLRATLKERQAELFERAVNATEQVHGKSGAFQAVIAALAEEKMRESLKQFLVVRKSFFVFLAISLLFFGNRNRLRRLERKSCRGGTIVGLMKGSWSP